MPQLRPLHDSTFHAGVLELCVYGFRCIWLEVTNVKLINHCHCHLLAFGTSCQSIPIHSMSFHSTSFHVIHSFVYSPLHPLIHSCIHSFFHSSIISCIHSFIHPLFTQLFLHFHFHFSPFIYSFIHSFAGLPFRLKPWSQYMWMPLLRQLKMQ